MQQEIENTKAQMRKGIVEFSVMLVIAKKGELYASTILDALTKANLIVVEGTLYPILNRLKRSELLSYQWKESKSGPPRKYYSLTKKGQHMVTSLTEAWKELSGSINSLL